LGATVISFVVAKITAKMQRDIERRDETISLYSAEVEAQNEEMAEQLLINVHLSRKFSRLFDSIPLVVLVMDEKTNIIETNEKAKKYFDEWSISRDLPFDRYLDEKDVIKLNQTFERLWSGDEEELGVDLVLVLEDDVRRLMHVEVAKSSYREVLFTLLMEDITESHKKEQIFRDQARHAAMGEMVGIIAHQWRQPLNYMSLKLFALIELFSEDDKNYHAAHSFYNDLGKTVQQLSTTIEDFREFFKPLSADREFLIKRCIEKTVALMHGRIEFLDVDIQIDCVDDLLIMGKENEFSHVFLNLIVNALDAIDENKIENPYIHFQVSKIEEKLRIVIEDNAGGIGEDIIKKIFEPYFSTKSFNGTGLGLYMCKIIVEDKYSGRIEVTSKNGSTRFMIEV